MGNKVNAAARSFCFLLIRVKSTLSMPGIFDFYTLMYLKARDSRVESSLFFWADTASGRQPCAQELAGDMSLSLSWNKTFNTSASLFHETAALLISLIDCFQASSQILSPLLIWQVLQKQSPISDPAVSFILLGCTCGTETARDRHICVSFPKRLQYCHHLGQKIGC